MGRRSKKQGSRKRGGGPSSPHTSGGKKPPDATSSTAPRLDPEQTPLRHAIGSRVEFPDLTSLGIPKSSDNGTAPHVGTVVEHWHRKDCWPDSYQCPYLVLLDDGTTVSCPHVDDTFIRASDVKAMEIKYSVGSRVECQLHTDQHSKWFPGTVIRVHENWIEDWRSESPYVIEFDYGRERPFWGPEESIRTTAIIAPRRRGALRFGRGDRVDCSIDEGWKSGTIVDTWYAEDEFDDGHAVPYQIQLDDGHLIYAPTDSDDYIRKSAILRKRLRFKVGQRVECNVEGGWAAGTIIKNWYGRGNREECEETDGRVVPYQVRLDTRELVYAPVDDDSCIRRPVRFKVGMRVNCLVDKDEWIPGEVTETWCEDEDEDCIVDSMRTAVPYKVKLDTAESVYVEDDDDGCIKKSDVPRVCRGQHNGFVRAMSKVMIDNQDYDGATKLLGDRIELIRCRIKNEEEDVDSWVADLSSCLLSLADVHLVTGDLDGMKQKLTEALFLIENSEDEGEGSRKCRMLFVAEKLAYHASLVDDKHGMLNYLGRAIKLGKETCNHDNYRMGSMLIKCGELNVQLNGEVEKGIEQMSDGVDILARVCGDDDQSLVVLAKKSLLAAREAYIGSRYNTYKEKGV